MWTVRSIPRVTRQAGEFWISPAAFAPGVMLSLRPCPNLFSSLLPRGSSKVSASGLVRFQAVFSARLGARALATAPALAWRFGKNRYPEQANTRYFLSFRCASVLAAQAGTEQLPSAPVTSTDSNSQPATTNEPSKDALSPTEAKKEEPKPEEPLVPIGSLLEFKRVDYCWEGDDWILKDSAPPKPTDDKYRGFSFTVVRTLDEITSRVKSLE